MEDDDMLDDEVAIRDETFPCQHVPQGIEKPGDPKMSKRKLKKMNRYYHSSD